MIKVVLFDFYGVFVPDSYSTWLADNNLKREGEFARLIEELDTDKISENVFLSRLSQLTKRKVSMAEIHSKSQNPDSQIVDIVRSLKDDYTVSLFSNASKKLRHKLVKFNLVHLFDQVIISGEIGHAKPSDEAFQIAIEKLGVDPSEILFIDDNPVNVAAANKNGINSVLYRSADDILQAL